MTITLIPQALPTMQPIRDAILSALEADMPAALVLVDPSVEPPAHYSEEVVNSYDLVQQWPQVSIFSGESKVSQGFQQFAQGMWSGQIIIDAFIQHQTGSTLTQWLDKYAQAICLVILNADVNRALGGGQLDTDSLEIEPDPGGGVENERAVEVRFNVWYRV